MVDLSPIPPPAAAVAPGGGERAVLQAERELSVRGLDANGPEPPAAGQVAAGVHEARTGLREQRAGPVDRVALGDAAEIEPEAFLQLDSATVDAHPAAARPWGLCVAVRGDFVKRAVVAGGDEGVVHGRIEPPRRPFSGLDGEARHRDEVLAGVQRAGAVERRELGVGAEAGEQRFQPLELTLGPGEGDLAFGARFGVQQELDLRAHRGERAPLDHDVLVIVSGGRVTTRTDGAAEEPKLGAEGACADASDAARAFAFAV